jgi:hypothetical protein
LSEAETTTQEPLIVKSTLQQNATRDYQRKKSGTYSADMGWSTEVMDVVLERWVDCDEKTCDDDARE